MLEEVNVISTVTSLCLTGTGSSLMLMKYLRRGFACTPNALHSPFAIIHVPIRGATRSTYLTTDDMVSQGYMFFCDVSLDISHLPRQSNSP